MGNWAEISTFAWQRQTTNSRGANGGNVNVTDKQVCLDVVTV